MMNIDREVGPDDRAGRIAGILRVAFAPTRLEVVDDSARHAGHAGMKGVRGGETHFNVLIESARFRGVGRVQRHRMVHEALAAEFEGGLHALSLVLEASPEVRA